MSGPVGGAPPPITSPLLDLTSSVGERGGDGGSGVNAPKPGLGRLAGLTVSWLPRNSGSIQGVGAEVQEKLQVVKGVSAEVAAAMLDDEQVQQSLMLNRVFTGESGEEDDAHLLLEELDADDEVTSQVIHTLVINAEVAEELVLTTNETLLEGAALSKREVIQKQKESQEGILEDKRIYEDIEDIELEEQLQDVRELELLEVPEIGPKEAADALEAAGIRQPLSGLFLFGNVRVPSEHEFRRKKDLRGKTKRRRKNRQAELERRARKKRWDPFF